MHNKWGVVPSSNCSTFVEVHEFFFFEFGQVNVSLPLGLTFLLLRKDFIVSDSLSVFI